VAGRPAGAGVGGAAGAASAAAGVAPKITMHAWRSCTCIGACMHACMHACEHEPCMHACMPCLQVPISSHLAAAATPQRAAEFLDALADAINRRAVETDPAALAAAQNAVRSSARRHACMEGRRAGNPQTRAWHALDNALRQTSSTRRP